MLTATLLKFKFSNTCCSCSWICCHRSPHLIISSPPRTPGLRLQITVAFWLKDPLTEGKQPRGNKKKTSFLARAAVPMPSWGLEGACPAHWGHHWRCDVLGRKSAPCSCASPAPRGSCPRCFGIGCFLLFSDRVYFKPALGGEAEKGRVLLWAAGQGCPWYSQI